MDIVFVILFMLAFFAFSMFARFKRVLAEQEGLQEAAQAASGEARADDESYFTYETVEEPRPQPVVARTQAPAAQVRKGASVEPSLSNVQAASGFDLRQAVISQVILNNPYNSEINQ